MQRLNWVRGSGIPRELAEGIAQSRIDQLAARGGRHSVAHFRRFAPEKRYAILAAFLLYVAEELTDRSMDFHRRLIGRMFRKSESKQWTGFLQQGPNVNHKLQNYARLTAVIAQAHKEGRSLDSAIQKEFAWDALEIDGQEAARLARPLDGSNFQDFRTQFPHFRQYTPKFVATFQFEGIPAQRSLLKALDTLREMNREEQTEIPEAAPRTFVKPKWAAQVDTAWRYNVVRKGYASIRIVDQSRGDETAADQIGQTGPKREFCTLSCRFNELDAWWIRCSVSGKSDLASGQPRSPPASNSRDRTYQPPTTLPSPSTTDTDRSNTRLPSEKRFQVAAAWWILATYAPM